MATSKSNADAPRAYSYIRFSTPEQALGDSERRQIEAARSWAEENDLVFDESLKDLGLSGYHGAHRKKGALGGFLKRVEAGAVPTGSVLVVEELRRLTREGIETALKEIFFKLWGKGITVQTLQPMENYEPGCGESTKFLTMGMFLQLAHKESKYKSILGKANWKQKRKQALESGKPMTGRCPLWLKKHDSEFELVEEAVPAYRKMFELYLDGMGADAIEKKLNKLPLWSPKNGWRKSYINKTLRNRSVFGEFQPHCKEDGKRKPEGDPLPNYYPAIIDQAVFFAVQRKSSSKKGKGGKTGFASNLFKGLVKCAYCGNPIRFDNKGNTGNGDDGKYFRCGYAYRGVKKGDGLACENNATIRYDECENLILECCPRIKPEMVLPNADEQARLCRSYEQNVAGRVTKLDDLELQIDNLVDQISKSQDPSMRDRFEGRAKKLQDEKDAVNQQLVNDRNDLREAKSALVTYEDWQRDLAELKTELAKDGNVELRQHVQSHLSDIIEKIEVFTTGHPHAYDSESRDGDSFELWFDAIAEEYFPEVFENDIRQAEMQEFVRYVTQLRMTKKGRFLRVHFKSSGRIDLVPEGSLATGFRWHKNSGEGKMLEVVGPDTELLWKDFKKKQRAAARVGKLSTT